MGTKLCICLSLRISLVAVFLPFAAFGQPSSQVQRSGGPDLQVMQEPALGRLEVNSAELQSLLVHVPSGTRAYLIGNLKGTRPAVVAWYLEEKKRLIAAVELRRVQVAAERPQGVGVNAGVSKEGSAPALLSIATARSARALLQPPGQVAVQAAGDARSYTLAPLLSFGGSTHLIGLAPQVPNKALQAREFSVRVYDRTGSKVAFKDKLPSRGGNVPVEVRIRTTKPNVPTPVMIINPADSDKLVSLRPLPPVSWAEAGGNESRTVLVPAGGSTSPGDAVSPVPGRHQRMAYNEHRSSTLGQQPLTEGPVAAGPDGTARVEGLSREPLENASIEGRNAKVSLTQGSPSGPPVAGRSSSLVPFAATIGAAAGVATLVFTTSKGDKHQETVTIVPVSQKFLEEQKESREGEVQITAISTPGLLLAQEAPTSGGPGRTTTAPRACFCIDGGRLVVKALEVTRDGIKATLEGNVGASLFGDAEETRKVKIKLGDLTGDVYVKGDPSWQLSPKGSCSFDGAGAEKELNLKCPDSKEATFQCKFEASFGWQRDSRYDRLIFQEGSQATVGFDLGATVENCEPKQLVAKASRDFKWGGDKATVSGASVAFFHKFLQPSFERANPCDSPRARLVCFLRAAGVSCKEIKEKAGFLQGMTAEEAEKIIKECCPDEKGLGALKEFLDCIAEAAHEFERLQKAGEGKP